jgi:predicted nucleic acid-binding protein
MNVRQAVLWDSSAVLALLDANDADHKSAVGVVRQIASERRPSFITNYIEVEAHALLLRKLGRMLAREWLLTGGLPVIRALPAEENLAKEIIARHSDKNWSLCDAISFAVMEARGVKRAFTFDHHFLQYSRIEVLGLTR